MPVSCQKGQVPLKIEYQLRPFYCLNYNQYNLLFSISAALKTALLTIIKMCIISKMVRAWGHPHSTYALKCGKSSTPSPLVRKRTQMAIPPLVSTYFFHPPPPFENITSSFNHFIFKTFENRMSSLNHVFAA